MPELELLLKDLEEQGSELKDIRQLAPLIVFLITKQEEGNALLLKLVEKNSVFDLSETNELLKKISTKETKINFPAPSKFPDIPVPDFSELSKLLMEIKLTLEQKRDVQPIIVQSSPQEKKQVIEDTAHASQVNVRTRAKSRFVVEVPTGAMDGVNKIFYLSRSPRFNFSQMFLFLNGEYQTVTNDYTISGNQITYVNAPSLESNHYVLIFNS